MPQCDDVRMNDRATAHGRLQAGRISLRAALLLLWFVVSFGTMFFARELPVSLYGWPLSYWIAAQGAILVFIAIVVVYAAAANRADAQRAAGDRARS